MLELSNDFINDWHDVQAHRQRMTDNNIDSSIVVIKISNIFVGDYHLAADRLLMIEQFLSLINPTLFINPSVRYRI